MSKQFHDDPFSSEEITPAISAEWVAKRRVAAALRELNDVLVSSTPAVEDLHAIAEALERSAHQFGTQPRIFGRAAFASDGRHGNFRQIAHELNPLSGISNPLAPPLIIWFKDKLTHGRVTMGWAYEGPPECVHGGYVTALFDQFMGMAQALGGQPGFTGTLTTRFHKRTPLNTPLELKGWVDKVEGRKTWVRAELRAGELLTASSDGIFVQPAGGFMNAATRRSAGPD